MQQFLPRSRGPVLPSLESFLSLGPLKVFYRQPSGLQPCQRQLWSFTPKIPATVAWATIAGSETSWCCSKQLGHPVLARWWPFPTDNRVTYCSPMECRADNRQGPTLCAMEMSQEGQCHAGRAHWRARPQRRQQGPGEASWCCEVIEAIIVILTVDWGVVFLCSLAVPRDRTRKGTLETRREGTVQISEGAADKSK